MTKFTSTITSGISDTASTPALSVLVPMQEHLSLDQCLTALARQEGLRGAVFEVIVVDSLYLRDWHGVVHTMGQRYPHLGIRFVQIERTRSRAKQLNTAVRLARAPLLLMLADDFIASPNLVSSHLQAHLEETGENIVAMGPGLFPEGPSRSDFMQWLEDSGELFGVSFTGPEVSLPPQFFYMANTSLKRTFLTRAGAFDERFPYDSMDDWEMGLRLSALGMKNVYLPRAVATHQHIIDLPERCRAMLHSGETSAIYDRVNPNPGPWIRKLEDAYERPARGRRESREQRYQRVLWEHWLKGYRAQRAHTSPRS